MGSNGLRSADHGRPRPALDLRLVDRAQRVHDEIELTRAARAIFKMLANADQRSLDGGAVKNPLNVLIQLIQAFRTGHFHVARSLKHIEQSLNVLGRQGHGFTFAASYGTWEGGGFVRLETVVP